MSEDVYSLLAVLDYYGINMDNIPSIKQDRLLTYAEYNDMAGVLNYLIKEKGILPKNIEKCPSVLYLNPRDVRTNYEFLSSTPLYQTNIDTCLHVLSCKPENLKATYDYVLSNYGIE